MHITKYTAQLLGMVSQAQRDKDLELEVLVKKYQNNRYSKHEYNKENLLNLWFIVGSAL